MFATASAVRLAGLTKTFRTERTRHRGALSRLRSLVAPRFDVVRAVDGLSLTIAPGERVAFIGPNGAGKSTTLKMLSGILHPDEGDAVVLGLVPWRDRTRLAYDIGTVFGQRSQLWYHLPPRDTFALLARVYEVDPAEHRKRLEVLLEAFDLGPCLDTPVRSLSLGQRMRAEIAASLLHAPRMLFLDEPTIGLDVSAKAMVPYFIRQNNEEEILFQRMLFAKIVPNCKKLGLLDGRDRWLRDRFTEMGVIEYEDYVDTSVEYSELNAIEADRVAAQ